MRASTRGSEVGGAEEGGRVLSAGRWYTTHGKSVCDAGGRSGQHVASRFFSRVEQSHL